MALVTLLLSSYFYCFGKKINIWVSQLSAAWAAHYTPSARQLTLGVWKGNLAFQTFQGKVIFWVRCNPTEKGADVKHQQPKSAATVDDKHITLVEVLTSKAKGILCILLRKPKKNQCVLTHLQAFGVWVYGSYKGFILIQTIT